MIGSLSDYLIGVEAGLNSNARKNRGEYLMEDLVEKFILVRNVYMRANVIFILVAVLN